MLNIQLGCGIFLHLNFMACKRLNFIACLLFLAQNKQHNPRSKVVKIDQFSNTSCPYMYVYVKLLKPLVE